MGGRPKPYLITLREICVANGVYYRDIAVGANVDKGAISRFFAGSPKCSRRRANRIRKYLRKIDIIKPPPRKPRLCPHCGKLL